MSLLDAVYQPSSVVVFDSLSQPSPSPLWHVRVDPSLPDDSRIELVDDEQLYHPVLEISSPNITKTYVETRHALGAHSGKLNVHLRRIGKRPAAIEVGVRDSHGTKGRIRLSTFQLQPRLRDDLLCVPLYLPDSGWSELAVDLEHLASLFRKASLNPQQATPLSSFSRLDYIRFYANLRVRRCWLGGDEAKHALHGVVSSSSDIV